MSYVLRAACVIFAISFGARAQPSSGPAQGGSSDQPGYMGTTRSDDTPARALAALRARPDVTITEQHGWTIAADRANHTIWSFAPPQHPAYPSAVSRQAVQKDGFWSIEMRVNCGAQKPVCDALVRDFEQLNQAVRRDLVR